MAMFGDFDSHKDMKNFLWETLKDSAKELNMSFVEFNDDVLEPVLEHWRENVELEREEIDVE